MIGHVAIALFAFLLDLGSHAKVGAQTALPPGEPQGGFNVEAPSYPPLPKWWTDIEVIDDLKLDSIQGRQTTFDGSQHVVMWALAMGVPGIFNSPEYLARETEPVALSLTYANFSGEELGGSPANILVEGAPPLEKGMTSVYRFACYRKPCLVGFGFSNLAKYGSGWGGDPLYVTDNGNLAGKGLIQGGFTPGHSSAGFVDFVVDVTQDDRVKIYIVQDLKPLGEAFSLDFSGDPQVLSTLRPFLRYSANNTVAVVMFNKVPVDIMAPLWYRTKPSISDPSQPFKGTWLMTVEKNGKEIPVTVTIKNYDQCGVKVVNTGKWLCQFDTSGHVKSDGVGATTLMFPLDEDHRVIEKLVFDKMKDIGVWGMADADTLTLSDAELATNWVFERVHNRPSHKNPFVANKEGEGEGVQNLIQ